MLGFPTHVVGTPTIRGKARRYEDSREDKGRATSGNEGRSGRGARREEKRDFSLREPTHSQERMRKKKSARFVRNDGGGRVRQGFEIVQDLRAQVDAHGLQISCKSVDGGGRGKPRHYKKGSKPEEGAMYRDPTKE